MRSSNSRQRCFWKRRNTRALCRCLATKRQAVSSRWTCDLKKRVAACVRSKKMRTRHMSENILPSHVLWSASSAMSVRHRGHERTVPAVRFKRQSVSSE
jgi:hypothetical protein